jgi:hypothetical protein
MKIKTTIRANHKNTQQPNHHSVSTRWINSPPKWQKGYKPRVPPMASRKSFWTLQKILPINQKACITCAKWPVMHDKRPFCWKKYRPNCSHMLLASSIKVFCKSRPGRARLLRWSRQKLKLKKRRKITRCQRLTFRQLKGFQKNRNIIALWVYGPIQLSTQLGLYY